MQWPPNIPENLVSHFVRGYFDGDGSIGVRIRKDRNGMRQLRIRICGLLPLLSGMQAAYTAVGNAGGYATKHSKVPGHYTLTYEGNINAPRFAAWMYDQSTPQTRLDRKYQVYQDFLNTRNVL
jgi:hypothetical protein